MKRYQKQFLNNYQWWDYSFLLKAMEDWFKKASYYHKTKGNLLRKDRTSKELFIMYQLTKRLREDGVYSNESRVFTSHNETYRGENYNFTVLNYEREQKARQRDLDLLTDMMRKHLFSWWD